MGKGIPNVLIVHHLRNINFNPIWKQSLVDILEIQGMYMQQFKALGLKTPKNGFEANYNQGMPINKSSGSWILSPSF